MTETADHPKLRSRLLVRIPAILFLVWLMVCLMLVVFQRKLVFVGHSQQHTQPIAIEQAKLPAGSVFDISVPVEANLSLAGWYCPAVPAESITDGIAASRPLVLYFGGNAGTRLKRVSSIALLHRVGVDVVIVDYRGFAENAGTPSEEGLAADAQATWDYVTQELGIKTDRIVLWGESLGGAVATRLAAELCEAETPPAGLILRATFASLVETASYHYPFVPVRTVLRDRFPSVDRIPRVTVPILHFHGTRDRVVPYTHGQELFDAAPAVSQSGVSKTFYTLENAGHNDIMYVAQDEIEAGTRAYLRSISLTSSTFDATQP